MKRRDNIFSSVPTPRVSRNFFDLSHEVKMSGKFSFLYPVLVMDTLPGDVINDQMTVFCRAAPMLAPVMHRINITTHFFFVPNRLLMDRWQDFITGGKDGTIQPAKPYVRPANMVTPNKMRKGTLWDYMGLPVWNGTEPTTSVQNIDVLPFRAYYQIWNDYYRDPNFDNEVDIGKATLGNVSATSNALFDIQRKSWRKDYFTAALPFAQRGAEVLLPLSATGIVTYKPVSEVYDSTGDAPPSGSDLSVDIGDPQLFIDNITPGRIENVDEVIVEGSEITINDFRLAVALQTWLEINARGGGRYVEQIEAHFDQRVPDYRLERAEYLGGGKQPIQISEVLSTANTDDVPVGDMAGHGISVGKSNRFSYRCPEHGWIIGLMSVTPETAYSQGIDRMWTRTSRMEYAWPSLAHLGEQEIQSKEVFYSFDQSNAAGNNELFGYIPRYSEYKFKQDRIAGDFRDSLAFWHLGRIFTARPALDASFTTMAENNTAEEETYRRIFAVQDGTDYFWFQLFHRLGARRPLPYFGVPKIVG